MNFLNGRKTYVVLAVLIIYTVVRVWAGEIDIQTAITIIGGALAGITMRVGIGNNK